jgi:KDO2-lipid IV(A) lauroyltransferase
MLSYLGLRFLIFLFSLVPIRLLYLKSNFVAALLRIFKYRSKTIEDSVNRVFQNEEEAWKKKLISKFYLNLSDISLEALKGFSLRQSVLEKRYKVINPEILEKYYSTGQSIIVVAGHFANWEWSPRAFTSQIKHKIVGLYKPLKNPLTDKYIREARAAHGAELRSIKNTAQIFKDNKDHACAYLMAADQSPSNVNAAYRMKFLGQDCLVLHGPEYYAKKYELPVIFGTVHRVARSKYEIVFEEIAVKPAEEKEGAITLKYMRRLEKDIYAKPQDWLWSHARWKRDPLKHCPDKVSIDG